MKNRINDGAFKGKHGPLLIAEIGGNHEGNFEYAKQLTELAIAADVDYIKFQIYTGNSLVSSVESPDRNKHFKKFELSISQHKELAQMVLDAGINYTSSVWDIEAIELMNEYIGLYKIGSGDLTAYPIVKRITRFEKPLIISTGLATEDEVLKSIEYIQNSNPIYKDKNMLGVLQCTSMYPINSSDAHLSVMNTFRDKTGLTIGYSDHTEGVKALQYAFAMGAEILEFHFTDNREGKQFRDHKVSLTCNEVKKLIEEITLIRQLKGSMIKEPVEIEVDNGHPISFRRAVYPSKDISKGEFLTEDNLTVLRPNHGIDAREYFDLIGKRSKSDLKKHQKLQWDLFEI